MISLLNFIECARPTAIPTRKPTFHPTPFPSQGNHDNSIMGLSVSNFALVIVSIGIVLLVTLSISYCYLIVLKRPRSTNTLQNSQRAVTIRTLNNRTVNNLSVVTRPVVETDSIFLGVPVRSQAVTQCTSSQMSTHDSFVYEVTPKLTDTSPITEGYVVPTDGSSSKCRMKAVAVVAVDKRFKINLEGNTQTQSIPGEIPRPGLGIHFTAQSLANNFTSPASQHSDQESKYADE